MAYKSGPASGSDMSAVPMPRTQFENSKAHPRISHPQPEARLESHDRTIVSSGDGADCAVSGKDRGTAIALGGENPGLSHSGST